MKCNENTQKNNTRTKLIVASLIALEVFFVFFIGTLFINQVIAGVGTNVTVITRLQVGNVYPEVINVTIDDNAASLDLTANSTKSVTVFAIVRDFNGDTDLKNATSKFFDLGSSFSAPNDNNSHYSNDTCVINASYGDAYEASVTCSYSVWYYANNATWNGTIIINDTYDYTDLGSDTILVNSLLSIGLPDSIDYGLVNATNVSTEQIVDVTNFGNVRVNLSLQGYAYNISDGWAMNCTLGTTRNISIYYEKYNLTSSNAGTMSLAQFETAYGNLTSNTSIKSFDLNYQQNEGVNEAVNATYWRVYVPKGVAGSCTGNILFGATRAPGT